MTSHKATWKGRIEKVKNILFFSRSHILALLLLLSPLSDQICEAKFLQHACIAYVQKSTYFFGGIQRNQSNTL